MAGLEWSGHSSNIFLSAFLRTYERIRTLLCMYDRVILLRKLQ